MSKYCRAMCVSVGVCVCVCGDWLRVVVTVT